VTIGIVEAGRSIRWSVIRCRVIPVGPRGLYRSLTEGLEPSTSCHCPSPATKSPEHVRTLASSLQKGRPPLHRSVADYRRNDRLRDWNRLDGRRV